MSQLKSRHVLLGGLLTAFSPAVVASAAGAAFLLASASDAHAIGQANGRVTGTVIEAASQAPVPGAKVALSGGSGVKRSGSTNEEGTFEIPEVPPGTYDLVLTYEGMKPVKRRVVVNADQATPVNIVWSAEAVNEETTVVQEERHLTNPDSPQTGMIVSMDRQNKSPIARQYQSVAAQVPGVTAVSGGNPQVKGARNSSNRYLVNGLDMTDPVTNTFSGNFQQDALESVSVTTGGFEAKYNALGSIVAMQTKRGTNEFHGAASAYWSPDFLIEYQTYGAQVYNGGKPWDYSSQRPPQGAYELNLSSQGPIIKDHLFYNAGIQYSRSNSVQPAGPPRFVQAPSRVFESIYLTGGITFVPVDAHRIHVEMFADPTTINYENNADTTANSTTPYSQAGRSQGGHRGTLEWAWQASKHVSTKVMVGYLRSGLDVGPQGIRNIDTADLIGGIPYDFHRPRHVNNDDGTTWFNTLNRQNQTRMRYQLGASINLNGDAAGHHDVEFGVQTAISEQRIQTTYTGGPAGKDDATGFGVTYTDRNGGALDSGVCDLDPYVNPGALAGNYTGNGCFRRTLNRNSAAHQVGTQFGVYIQDRYKPKKWLTILPGVRFDTGTVRATDSQVAQTANGIGPRLSVLADITNDQKTIAQLSYGRMTEMPSLTAVSQYDRLRRNFAVVEQYDPTSRQFALVQTSGGAQGAAMRSDRVSASADEILASLRREIGNGVLARIDYTYRVLHRQFETEEINAIMDPTGTRTIGYVNGVPTRVFLYGFNPRSTAQYSGTDLILEARFKDFEVQGGYTLSYSFGTAANSPFDNPRFNPFYESYQTGVDRRHAIKTQTTYSFLGGFTIGLIVNWRSGVAMSKDYQVAEAGNYQIRRAPAGYEPGAYYNTGTANPGQLGTYSDVRSWTEFRSPDLLSANLMLSYDFKELLKQHLIVNAQVNNVLALSTPTGNPPDAGVIASDGAPNTTQFGLAAGRTPFRSVQLGVRYEF